MRVFKIQKKNGKFRTIYAPDEDHKARCRNHAIEISKRAADADSHKIQHGFTNGRSPVTNAMIHRRWEYTLSMDLESFFDTVTPTHCSELSETVKADCFYDGAARQGLPSSPAIANLAAAPMDTEIMELQRTGRFTNFVYSRYADDLTFSFNHPDVGVMLQGAVPRIAASHGFKVNEAKTHLQCAKAGRRMITGVAVDSAVHTPREIKRRIRAAKHQIKTGQLSRRTLQKLLAKKNDGAPGSLRGLLVNQLRGLNEWAKLRLPKQQTALQDPLPVRQRRPTTTRMHQTGIIMTAYQRKILLSP